MAAASMLIITAAEMSAELSPCLYTNYNRVLWLLAPFLNMQLFKVFSSHELE